jgi:hypothetical protein
MAFEWVKDTVQGFIAAGLGEFAKDTTWKNLPFDPAGRKLWLKIIYVPVTEDAATLGVNGENELKGFVQIGVYQQAGTGTMESDEALDKINALLAIPQRLNAPVGCLLRLTSKTSGQGGQTSTADTSAGGTEGLWDANYVTVYWLAREPR